jgi:hypothetical protein
LDLLTWLILIAIKMSYKNESRKACNMSDSVVLPFRPWPIKQSELRLGVYLRPGFHHIRDCEEILADRSSELTGIIFDASNADRQRAVWEAARARKIDLVFDPETQALAAPHAHRSKKERLKWAFERPHTCEDLAGDKGAKLIALVVEEALARRSTSILATSHFLSDGASDPWFQLDVTLCQKLRAELDRRGARSVDIYYSLALPMRELRKADTRRQIIRALRGLPFDELWLRVSDFGSGATGPALAAYVEAAREFQQLDVPVLADHVGGLVGLNLLAVGAVGGLAHGITVGERFDHRGWFRKSSGGGNGKRIYLEKLDLFLRSDEAIAFFGAKGAKARFVCADTLIAPSGLRTMQDQPGKFFGLLRLKQVRDISRVPPSQRSAEFMEKVVRPFTDQLAFASTLELPVDLKAKIERQRKRIDRMRPVYGQLSEQAKSAPIAKVTPSRAERDSMKQGELI